MDVNTLQDEMVSNYVLVTTGFVDTCPVTNLRQFLLERLTKTAFSRTQHSNF